MARKTELDFHVPPSWPAKWVLGGDRFIVIGRWHFLVKSKSEDGYHCVDLEPVEGFPEGGCTCTSFRVRGECRHVRLIREHLGLS